MGLHLALGVALGAIFIFMAKFSITFATNEALPAFIGVWIPNLIFSLIAILLIAKAQK
jgi:lipopolysaccharide export system permease protein